MHVSDKKSVISSLTMLSFWFKFHSQVDSLHHCMEIVHKYNQPPKKNKMQA